MTLKILKLLIILTGFFLTAKAQYAIPFVSDETFKYYLHFYIQEQAESDDYIPLSADTGLLYKYDDKSLPSKKQLTGTILVFRGFFKVDKLFSKKELGFHIGWLNYPCRIFCNGKLVYTLGSYKDTYTPKLRFSSGVMLPPDFLKYDSINEISIQIYQRYNENYPLDKLFIASKKVIDRYTFMRNYIGVNLIQATLIVSIILAVYFLFLFGLMKDKKNIKYLFYATFCIFLSLGYSNTSFSYNFFNNLVYYRISRMSLPLANLFLVYYTISATKVLKIKKLTASLFAIPILVFVGLFINADSLPEIEDTLKLFTSTINIPYFMFAITLVIISFIKTRRKRDFAFLTGYIVLLIATYLDSVHFVSNTTPYTWLIPHGFLFFIIIVFFILSLEQTNEFKLSLERGKQLQEIRDYLEITVEERTALVKTQNEELIVQAKSLEKANFEIIEQKEVVKRFFANVSHELRTPLTLIVGYMSNLVNRHEIATDISEVLKSTMKNAQRLKLLINQILDLSKLDEGKLKLELVRDDLIAFLKPKVYAFESLAESKGILFKVTLHTDKLEMIFDPEKLEIMVNNLLSNGIKFNHQGGNLLFETSGDHDFLYIMVKDTGIGIPEQAKSKIFERYFQVNNTETTVNTGTGIGLSLTKDLVDLHHGSIEFNSQLGIGTEFTIKLPLAESIYKDDPIVASKNISFVEEKISVTKDEDRNIKNGLSDDSGPLILVVEDNIELRKFIHMDLQGKSNPYHILEASDGSEGFNIAIKEIPDLIIMDWMMPVMDGIELCAKIKENFRTSHIPVIMLTAKADLESKLQGLEKGADAYLTKPFETIELHATIENLLHQRALLKEKYSRNILGIVPEELSSVDEKFLLKLKQIINRELINPKLDVLYLSNEIGLSRSQLLRKLKALTDLSPNEYIRLYRLEKAYQRLQSGAGNVSEIAYTSGFENLSYFSKCFFEQYKIHPSELVNNTKSDN